MKHITFGALALLMAVAAQASTTDSLPKAPIVECIEYTGRVVIDQPQALNKRLMPKGTSAALPKSEATDEREAQIDEGEHASAGTTRSHAGYRVQVFDDNNPRTARRDAAAMKSMMESRFPEWRAYVSFNSPYWRVKVGDFSSRAEAEAAAGALKEAFPQHARLMRVVRDRINAHD